MIREMDVPWSWPRTVDALRSWERMSGICCLLERVVKVSGEVSRWSRTVVAGFDRPDGLFKRPREDTLADRRDHDAEHSSLQVLALSDHHDIHVGRPIW